MSEPEYEYDDTMEPIMALTPNGKSTMAYLFENRTLLCVDCADKSAVAEWLDLWACLAIDAPTVGDGSFFEKQLKAHQAVSAAIKRGDLKRSEMCSACEKNKNNSRIIGHHDDYNRPLEVRWLCETCHRRHHALHGKADS